MSPEEERQRQQEAAEGFNGFMGKLSEALSAATHEPPEDREWNEFDYEKLMRESDARTDKYSELLDKYMDHPDRERIIAREMGWSWLEEALDEQEAEEYWENEELDREGGDGPFDVSDEAPPLEPDPTTEGVDWIRDEDGDISHPLSLRAFHGGVALWRQCQELGLGKLDDDDLSRLISEYQITGAKLAGALDSLAYGRDLREGAFIVAYLKRALNHLHAAQAALEQVVQKALLPVDLINSTRTELFALREEILRLMEEFRGQSK